MGFEKQANYVIRKNGSYYESIKGYGTIGSGTNSCGGASKQVVTHFPKVVDRRTHIRFGKKQGNCATCNNWSWEGCKLWECNK